MLDNIQLLEDLQFEPVLVWSHDLVEYYTEVFDDKAKGYVDNIRIDIFHRIDENGDCLIDDQEYKFNSSTFMNSNQSIQIGDYMTKYLDKHRDCSVEFMILYNEKAHCFVFEPRENPEEVRALFDPEIAMRNRVNGIMQVDESGNKYTVSTNFVLKKNKEKYKDLNQI